MYTKYFYTKCIPHFNKLSHKFCIKNLVLLILYTKCIQKLIEMWYTFCVRFVYISCIHIVQLLYTKCIHSFCVGSIVRIRAQYSLVIVMGTNCIGNCFTKLWSTKLVEQVAYSSSWSILIFHRYLRFIIVRVWSQLEFVEVEGLQPGIEVASAISLKLGVIHISMIKETCWCNLLITNLIA